MGYAFILSAVQLFAVFLLVLLLANSVAMVQSTDMMWVVLVQFIGEVKYTQYTELSCNY